MSGNDSVQAQQKTGSSILFLELAVPAFSFGGALLALFFSGAGSNLDPRYFATGCVISSFVLAYLAWIRPRKDIVALTTPIYSIIFFVAPSDMAVNLVLELLYATSLTILLVRLKYRFGAAPESGIAAGKKTLEEPLFGYCEAVRERVPGVMPGTAHYGAMAFALFAQGDYLDAVKASDAAMTELAAAETPQPVLVTAFGIVREQALLLEESADLPDHFTEFSVADSSILAKSLPPDDKPHDRFEVTLENALLLLYAVGWNASAGDHKILLNGQNFALKLTTS